MIRRLPDYRSVFGEEDPVVHILAPSPERPIPAGDTRRGTAWLFRTRERAEAFAAWIQRRHGIETVAVAVKLRLLAGALAPRDLTFVLDPEPRTGYGNPLSFKAPLPH